MSDLSPRRMYFWTVAAVRTEFDRDVMDNEPELRLFSSRGAAVSWAEDIAADLNVSPLPAPSYNSDFVTAWDLSDDCAVYLFIRLIPVDAER